jgi:hypothetical protein
MSPRLSASPADLLALAPAHAWAAVLVVPVLQRFVARLGLWPYAVFALPGTLAHEASHWLVAALTGARPRGLRLWPERTPHGWRLGSVAFQPAWWRTAAIALAPLALLPLALIWTIAFVAPADGIAFAVHAWIAGTLLGGSLPSRADLRLAGPALVGVLAVALAALLALR